MSALAQKVVELPVNVGIDTQLTPREIVKELDRYIISQNDAKKAVAVALRNRWRRLQVKGDISQEITPKNIIMMGPTGVGKTEIARRLSKLARAPFVKVEATKFTEVGYVGRDVDAIIRDLVDASYQLVREEERKKVLAKADALVEERLLDYLLPGSAAPKDVDLEIELDLTDKESQDSPPQPSVDPAQRQSLIRSREKLREMLRDGKIEERIIEIETQRQVQTQMQVLGPQGFAEIEGQIKDLFSNMVPKQKDLKKLKISEAREILRGEEQDALLDHEKVCRLAIQRAEESGIVFIDEIDKICGAGSAGKGPDVSREGVQRDLLPLVEGSTVGTKYGICNTDHVLFIASGAFHISKPSDLMPEFQGRFPIRVELQSLTPDDFVRILTEPENALTKQYQELLKTEQVEVQFLPEAIRELANLTAEVNSNTENIGARRLHTLLEKVLEDVAFAAEDYRDKTVIVDKEFVSRKLHGIVKDRDLSRFVL